MREGRGRLMFRRWKYVDLGCHHVTGFIPTLKYILNIGIYSGTADISGVMQGPLLGPLLFYNMLTHGKII